MDSSRLNVIVKESGFSLQPNAHLHVACCMPCELIKKFQLCAGASGKHWQLCRACNTVYLFCCGICFVEASDLVFIGQQEQMSTWFTARICNHSADIGETQEHRYDLLP